MKVALKLTSEWSAYFSFTQPWGRPPPHGNQLGNDGRSDFRGGCTRRGDFLAHKPKRSIKRSFMCKGWSDFYVKWLRVFTDIIDLIHRSLEENTVAFPPKTQAVNPARGGQSTTPGWPLCGAASVLITLPKLVLLSWKISWKLFDIFGLVWQKKQKKKTFLCNFLRCNIKSKSKSLLWIIYSKSTVHLVHKELQAGFLQPSRVSSWGADSSRLQRTLNHTILLCSHLWASFPNATD